MAERAVVYLRVSSQAQEVAMQRRECRDYLQARGYHEVEWVEEKETGVDSYDWRDGMKRVRELLYAGGIDVLLVWKVDRANRDSTDNLRLLRLADDTGVRLESVHDGVIPNDMAGRMKMFMLGESGRAEWDSIILRTRAGLRERVEGGMPLVGKYPLYGYRYTYGPGKKIGTLRKTGYEIEPETAAIVRRCYESIVAGYSLNKLTQELTREGVPTPTQRLARQGLLKPGAQVAEVWNRPRVRQILVNPSYTGKHVAYRTKSQKVPRTDERGNVIPNAKPRRVATLRAEGDKESVVLSIPPIVDEELWAQVQVRMTANRAESVRRNRDPESTLLRSGFAFCGHCGAPMVSALYHNPKRPHIPAYRVYTCSRRRSVVDNKRQACPGGSYVIRAAEVDCDTWRKATEIARDVDKVQRLIDSRHKRGQEALEAVQREAANLAAEVEEYEKQKATLQRRMATETDDTVYAMLREESRRVTAILAALEKRRKATSVQVGRHTLTLVSLQELMQRLENAGALGPKFTDFAEASAATRDPLATLTYQEKREVLRLLGVKVNMYSPTSDYAKTHDGARWEFVFQPEPDPEMYSVSIWCQ